MAKKDTSLLLKCLKPFSSDVTRRAMMLREFVWDLYPKANELIYDNYNAVAFGWSPTDRVGHIFCSIAVGRSNQGIHFGFYWGSKIADPKGILLGEGNQYRYIRVPDMNDFPKTYMKKLLRGSYLYSLSIVKDPNQIIQGQTILKSVSAKKRPPALKKKIVPEKRSGT